MSFALDSALAATVQTRPAKRNLSLVSSGQHIVAVCDDFKATDRCEELDDAEGAWY
jgi:hypothetical protein